MTRSWSAGVSASATENAAVNREVPLPPPAGAAQSAPAAYRANLAAVVGYVLKGASPAAARKLELQRLADETGLTIQVCHLPPGTSKWNKIEHRLFSFISQNWRGTPLVSYEVIVSLIAATTTATGLRVHSVLDTNRYPTGRTVSDAEMATVQLERDAFHGEWNYAIHPAPRPPSSVPLDPLTS